MKNFPYILYCIVNLKDKFETKLMMSEIFPLSYSDWEYPMDQWVQINILSGAKKKIEKLNEERWISRMLKFRITRIQQLVSNYTLLEIQPVFIINIIIQSKFSLLFICLSSFLQWISVKWIELRAHENPLVLHVHGSIKSTDWVNKFRTLVFFSLFFSIP